MSSTSAFSGHVLLDTRHDLAEGPTYDAGTDTAWWLDILGKTLTEHHLTSGRTTVHPLPVMASVLAFIDDRRQLLASDQGLYLRDTASGELTLHATLEPDRPDNRSNDGRVHQSGALWIGTMGKTAATGAGSIYHVAGTTVTKLYGEISIPNSICFSPDGTVGYFTDTRVNKLMQVALDPAKGLPIGAPSVLIDGTGEDGGFDGSVCDAEGTIWNARWGVGAVDRYDAAGQHLARYLVPARQTTCPAFIGRDAGRMLVTSATENLNAAGLAADPLGGHVFDLGISVKGKFDPKFRI
ncbi:SMP-30/gluconolactonase/LRE family protein [Rhizobium sp. CG5]|uniref:SMP-30/gluconolactonase/LRE family protein n=1 Tax=Rhizobium sp. CG5 TaxID=2726076 RepID=UPI0020348A6E|nr:SMP-30/gluconolactonase/LRE family protein [Rhizobium sp. CG5]MCM2472994.1 SMP-30/gluconolactonase/LRE family protein [Rhizobium sp. CG5]